MSAILTLAVEHPAAGASVISAIIAASVALVVFALTQLLARVQARRQFLTPKLDELYLLLNDIAADNVRVTKLLYLAHGEDEGAKLELSKMDELDVYGHAKAKKVIMLVRLYFPQLSRSHQRLFAAERARNDMYARLHGASKPTIEELIDVGGRVGHFLRLMEGEIIRNRDDLLQARILRRRYRHSTDADIANQVPPPNLPLFVRQNTVQDKSTPSPG